LWVIFALLDPDPESGYGSIELIESGSNPDHDSKHCLALSRRQMANERWDYAAHLCESNTSVAGGENGLAQLPHAARQAVDLLYRVLQVSNKK
jgi:hypothetical protein